MAFNQDDREAILSLLVAFRELQEDAEEPIELIAAAAFLNELRALNANLERLNESLDEARLTLEQKLPGRS